MTTARITTPSTAPSAAPTTGSTTSPHRPPRPPLVEILLMARRLWPRLALAALAGAAALGSAVALTATSAWLLSRAAQHPPVLTLMVAIVAVRAFGLSRGVFRYAERLLAHDAAFRVMSATRVTVFSALERLAPTGLAGYRSADLLRRLVDDVDGLTDLYLRVAVPVVSGGLVGLAAATGLGLVAPLAGGTLLAGLVLAGVALPWWAARAGARAEVAAARLRGDLSVAVLDAIEGAPDLLAYGAYGGQLATIRELDGELTAASRSSALVAGVSAGLTTLVSGLTTLCCLLLGIAAVRAGRLPGVLLAVVVLTPMVAFEAVAGFPAAGQQLARLQGSARRVLGILHRPVPSGEPDHPRALPAGPLHLRLESVDVRWPGAAALALSGVSLDLPAGHRVAIVGPSGAGKSTLAALLLVFLRPEAGRLLVNGIDGRRLAGDDVRSAIGWCGQDAHVFDATIGDNVRIGDVGADQPAIRAALDRARLLDWVESLPLGLDTPVGEHGRQLSGGQRQRLALARALLADRHVVVLDEPTEHVEEDCADELTQDLLAATRPAAGQTTVLVTHRLSGLQELDEIVVLEAGRITQRGTHAALLAVPGWYRTAWTQQECDRPPAIAVRDLRP